MTIWLGSRFQALFPILLYPLLAQSQMIQIPAIMFGNNPIAEGEKHQVCKAQAKEHLERLPTHGTQTERLSIFTARDSNRNPRRITVNGASSKRLMEVSMGS